jgi:hypothetical protein
MNHPYVSQAIIQNIVSSPYYRKSPLYPLLGERTRVFSSAGQAWVDRDSAAGQRQFGHNVAKESLEMIEGMASVLRERGGQ